MKTTPGFSPSSCFPLLSDKVHHFFDTCKNNHNQCHISEGTSSQQPHMHAINSLAFILKKSQSCNSIACFFTLHCSKIHTHIIHSTDNNEEFIFFLIYII